MTKPIGIIRAGGVGPEIMDVALMCLKEIEKQLGVNFSLIEYGGLAPAKEYSEEAYQELKGFYHTIREQNGCILRAAIYARIVYQLRRDFCLICKPIFFNPIPELLGDSTLKSDYLKNLDILLIRENTKEFILDEERVDCGEGKRIFHGLFTYREEELRVLAHFAFDQANRRKKLLYVFVKKDLAGVFQSFLLEIFEKVSKKFPEVLWSFGHSDTGTVSILKATRFVDVIVALNREGDLIADPLAVLLYGTHAVVPSANINPCDGFMVFQTVHGTSHAIAQQNKANPIGMVRASAMMLRLFFKLEKEADVIEIAVRRVLGKGYRTVDMYRPDLGHTLIGTKEMGELIVAEVSSNTKDGL